jgi:hypothetical protein
MRELKQNIGFLGKGHAPLTAAKSMLFERYSTMFAESESGAVYVHASRHARVSHSAIMAQQQRFSASAAGI